MAVISAQPSQLLSILGLQRKDGGEIWTCNNPVVFLQSHEQEGKLRQVMDEQVMDEGQAIV
jgi:hypothetical protein